MNHVIELENVSLSRRTQEEFHYDLKRLLFALVQRRYRKPSRRQVLDQVSLRIRASEKIGIIGANGSGKSTLLKAICGILSPSSGNVAVNGRIAPLIELGAGFDDDLSVVENIIYYAVLLGVPDRLARSSVASIIEFAELSDHRNEPVKALSSGMRARLGFAIATEIRPEILILDEVLSVGDERFRRKCEERINRFWDEHSTILVVSHDLDFIARNCNRAVWMEAGRVEFDGPAVEATLRYRASLEEPVVSPEARQTRRKVVLLRGMPGSTHGDRIYAAIGGVKRWVCDGRWLVERGLRGDHAMVLPDNSLDAIPDGHPIRYEDRLEEEVRLVERAAR